MMTVLVTLCAIGVGAPDAWTTDADGRTFRVGFDPGSRLVLGAGWAWQDESQLTLEAAWLVRAVDRDRGVNWKLAHAIGAVTATVGADTGIAATLYRGEYLRWSADGAIMIPTTPPTRLAFPLDIGFALEVASLRTHPERVDWPAEIGVVATELLFDAWRSPEVGSYIMIGVGPRYDLWLDRRERVRHVVTPFSAARLTLHHEWSRGRQLVEATIGAGTAWTSGPGTDGEAAERWTEHVRAELAWEWIVLAVNDRPVALCAWGAWRWDERVGEAAVGARGHIVRGGVGVRLGL